jgi:hypothetical protein
MLVHPLLPPRGVFIPTHMVYNSQLPPALLVTWIQLRGLAWDGWVTPSLSMQELATLTGKRQATLYRHMSQLRHLGALSWHTTESGLIIVSFFDEPPKERRSMSDQSMIPTSKIPAANILDSTISRLPDPSSYFPARILGYLSFQEDLEVFPDLEDPKDMEYARRKGESDIPNLYTCIT